MLLILCGGAGVTDYRLYLLDHRGRIMRAVDIACADDAVALDRAAAVARGQPAELWDRARMVGRIGVAEAPKE